MTIQASNTFTQRVNGLMKQQFITKKEMAQKLNVDYSTFWRKLNGQRNVDMILLKRIAEILGTSTAYLTGETNIPIAIPKPPEQTKYETNYSYWGGVVDNSREVAEKGDKDAIAYVSQMLRRALSLITNKTEIREPTLTDKPLVTNMPVIVGDNNESNLTLATV